MQEQNAQATQPTDPTLDWFLSHCHIHKYPSKSTLINAGEKAETLYYLIQGSVSVMVKDEDGKEMILTYLVASGMGVPVFVGKAHVTTARRT